MSRAQKAVAGALGIVVLGGVLGVLILVRHGLSARDEPTRLEVVVARTVRHLAVPRPFRDAPNPVPLTPATLTRARAHFADHCASCHGNDGRGNTPMGQNLYPKAPDMWAVDTQSLSDGELFYIIENGIRLTGMPAWGKPGPEDDLQTWDLVHLIRHFPRITPEELAEMADLNPMSRSEFEEQWEIQIFLAGGDPPEVGGNGNQNANEHLGH